MTTFTELQHRDPACTAGFSVVLETSGLAGPTYDDDEPYWQQENRPDTVHLRCWTCDTWHQLEPATNQLNREADGRAIDLKRADRPWITGEESYGRSLRTLAAAVPPVKVGRGFLHADRRSGFGSWNSTDDVYEWLVTDTDGNVLGIVARYSTERLATRFRCGLGIGQGTLREGFQSAEAAARAVLQAAL